MDAQIINNQRSFLKKILYLEPYSDRKAKQLSGGNKRKLCSAMALMFTPDLIMMDEASNGVDPLSRKNLYAYLSMLENTSTLMITHRIDEAEKICDKIAIMANGKILDVGSSNFLKEKYGKVFFF
jgi:ABC-type multidrug transport system ATPase subunit